jgi:hypothetical protein
MLGLAIQPGKCGCIIEVHLTKPLQMYELRYSQRWFYLVTFKSVLYVESQTDVSEEHVASIYSVEE